MTNLDALRTAVKLAEVALANEHNTSITPNKSSAGDVADFIEELAARLVKIPVKP